jgi:Ni,Fe-hydrogenase III large subunit
MSAWEEAGRALAAGQTSLVSLWADGSRARLALLSGPDVRILDHPAPGGHYPSIGRLHPPALRLERALAESSALVPDGLPDTRPWLLHGAAAASYPFLPVKGAHLHQIPVGPVHAGIIEPGHFRFTCAGETIVRLEERLGYVHRGVEALMEGKRPEEAAKIAARISGDSTVAYAIAFARAVESALGVAPPPRALWLASLMAELERLANHLGDFGAICNDAAFALMLSHCGILRERVLRASFFCFGHRLMMDRILPGGAITDLSADGIAHLRALVAEIGQKFPRLLSLYDRTASLQDRTVGTGILRPDLAQLWAAGGFVGRASGRDFDARRLYPPYDSLAFATAVRSEGDVDARLRVRAVEIMESLGLITQILDRLPSGPIRSALPDGAGEGFALIEGFRGDIFLHVRLEGGRIARCHARDPSWFQWPLLEAAIAGNIVADFPICNKSFNCSYAGHDL